MNREPEGEREGGREVREGREGEGGGREMYCLR